MSSSERKNWIDLEEDIASVEANAFEEEQQNAKSNYDIFRNRYLTEKNKQPYPDVEEYSVGHDYDEIADLQWKKKQNAPHVEAMKYWHQYLSCDSLYAGHLQTEDGNEYYFMENNLPSDTENPHRKFLNTDEKIWQQYFRLWKYPKREESVSFSRNITIKNQRVKQVDIVIDNRSASFSNITDTYLRNALLRNKEKEGLSSIIQTIQEKQDDIRVIDQATSFVVQGCAGSGKSMVLLHRIRYLLFNQEIRSGEYLFLVPSDDFRSYITNISSKFGIHSKAILPYTEYYQMQLGKKPASTYEDLDETVFSEDYLRWVYGNGFLQECYREFLNGIFQKTNDLISLCDRTLILLMEHETTEIETAVESAKRNAILYTNEMIKKLHWDTVTEISGYQEISAIQEALSVAIEKRKEEIKKVEQSIHDVTVSFEEKKSKNERLLQIMGEIEEEKESLKKASVFTRRSHKNKLQILTEKYDAYYKEWKEHNLEEERKILRQSISEMEFLFPGVQLLEAEVELTALTELFARTENEISQKLEKKNHLEEHIEEKYSDGIEGLNQLIELSSEMEAYNVDIVSSLEPMEQYLNTYIMIGKSVCQYFTLCSPIQENKDEFIEEYKVFSERTPQQLQAYLNTLLLNLCKKKIREKFNIKISEKYKHYWYISLYTHYLTHEREMGKSCSHIFIDEAQDLSQSEHELIYKINTSGANCPVVNVFGDINQVISGHAISSWDNLPYVHQTYYLEENFRNTNQIVEYCNQELSFSMQKVGVDKDEVIVFDSMDMARSTIQANKDSIFIVKDEYAKKDFETIISDGDKLRIYTVKKVKGLEFKEVFVVEQDMTENEKYISYTRALSKLYVIKSLPAVTDRKDSLIVQGEE